MDGLLVDTEPIWTVAEVELAERLGGTLHRPRSRPASSGPGSRPRSRPCSPRSGTRPRRRWSRAPRARCSTGWSSCSRASSPPRPGALELHAGVRAAGVPVALVSSSYRVLVDGGARPTRAAASTWCSPATRSGTPSRTPSPTPPPAPGSGVDPATRGRARGQPGRHRQRRGRRLRGRGGPERAGRAPRARPAPTGRRLARRGRPRRPRRASCCATPPERQSQMSGLSRLIRSQTGWNWNHPASS